jgi:hypothetical protein
VRVGIKEVLEMWVSRKAKALFLGVSLMGSAAMAQTFTFDELLPHPYSAFTTLRAGQTSMANVHDSPRTGTITQSFPTNWAALNPGTSLRLKVLVPPGVSMVSWYVQAPNLVAGLGACDEAGSDCREEAYPPTLWPVRYNNQAPGSIPLSELPALTSPKIVYLTVKPYNVTFEFLALYVTYTVKDPQLYESWRSQRRWAGGNGDCDGLNGAYASGLSCEASSNPGNPGTFSLTPVGGTVLSGQPYQFNIVPATTVPKTCVARKMPANQVVDAPSINTGLAVPSVTGTAPALSVNENDAQLVVDCQTESGQTATGTLTVNPAPGTRSTLTAAAQVNLLTKKVNLTAKFTPSSSEKGRPVKFWIGAEVKAFGWSVDPVLFMKNATGGWEDFSFAKTLDGSNVILSLPSFPEAGQTVQVLNYDLLEDDLKTIGARVFGAYRVGDGPLQTFSQPIYDCTTGSCVAK